VRSEGTHLQLNTVQRCQCEVRVPTFSTMQRRQCEECSSEGTNLLSTVQCNAISAKRRVPRMACCTVSEKSAPVGVGGCAWEVVRAWCEPWVPPAHHYAWGPMGCEGGVPWSVSRGYSPPSPREHRRRVRAQRQRRGQRPAALTVQHTQCGTHSTAHTVQHTQCTAHTVRHTQCGTHSTAWSVAFNAE
jgi:hypothetical protein